MPCRCDCDYANVHRFRACGGNSGRRPIAGDLHGGLIIYWLRLRCGADPKRGFRYNLVGRSREIGGNRSHLGILSPPFGIATVVGIIDKKLRHPHWVHAPSLACRPSSKRTTFDDTPTRDRSDANRSNLSASSHLPLRTFAPSWAPPGRDARFAKGIVVTLFLLSGAVFAPLRSPKPTSHILGTRTTASLSPAV